MNEEDRLKEEAATIMRKLDKIERDRRVAENSKKIGKHFKYSNSYGSGAGWWMYLQVIGIDEHGACLTWSFQCTSHGEFQVQKKEYGDHVYEGNGYIQITKSEFKKAWNRHIASILRYGEGI